MRSEGPRHLVDGQGQGRVRQPARPVPYWHHAGIDPNPFGIRFRDDFAPPLLLLYIDAAIFADPVLRFLCARHLPWVVLNVILVIFAAVAAGLTRTPGRC